MLLNEWTHEQPLPGGLLLCFYVLRKEKIWYLNGYRPKEKILVYIYLLSSVWKPESYLALFWSIYISEKLEARESWKITRYNNDP